MGHLRPLVTRGVSQVSPDRLRSLSRVLFLALVALLPLHTVFVQLEIAWKPWLILLIAVTAVDLWVNRRIPWARRVLLGVAVFLSTALVSWPGGGATFWRLWLAIGAGTLLMLTVAHHGERVNQLLRVVFWSSAALGFTAVVLGLVTNGLFGADAVSGINDVALVERVNKPAYLETGFVALTNWHQDPGYAALWTNVWLVLSGFAWIRGVVKAPDWVGPLVFGGLVAASILTYSRTGWLGLPIVCAVLLIAHWRRPGDESRSAMRLVAFGLVAGLLLVGLQIALDRPGVGGDVITALDFRLAYIAELGSISGGESSPGGLVVPDNRLDVWAEYGRRFAGSPLRGIGLGTGWAETGLQEPHSLWLELLAETGLIGTLGFLFLLATLGRGGGVVATSVLVVVAVATLTQTVLFEPVLWFALGLWIAGSKRKKPIKAHAA